MRGQKIFNSFLIVVASTILFLIPFTQSSEAIKTDQRDDIFSVVTAAAQTTDNIILSKALYDNDVTTITVISDSTDDAISWGSYNATGQQLLISGMDASNTRVLTATYDVNALNDPAIETLVDAFIWIWILSAVAFAPSGLASIWTNKD